MLDEAQIKLKSEEIREKIRALRRTSRDYRRNEEYMNKEPIPYWKYKHNLDVENLEGKKEILKWILE